MVLGRAAGQRTVKASSSSRHVAHAGSIRLTSGRQIARRNRLSAAGIRVKKIQDNTDLISRLQGMAFLQLLLLFLLTQATEATPTEQAVFESLQNIPEDDLEPGWEMDPLEVLAGNRAINISHAGGELSAMSQDVLQQRQ